jgi:TolA-binding protein
MNPDASSAQKQEPVAQSAAPVTDISIHDLKKVAVGREKKRENREKSAGSAKKQASVEKQHAAAASDSASGQKLFERAVKAYRQDDYRTALELFDKYLAENQASPLAADASLYKAECYLKMSVQK